MKELVEVIAKSLVENPEEVTVTERQSGKTTVVELKVAPSDMGKVIGKQGRICLLYTSPSPRDRQKSRMPSSA